VPWKATQPVTDRLCPLLAKTPLVRVFNHSRLSRIPNLYWEVITRELETSVQFHMRSRAILCKEELVARECFECLTSTASLLSTALIMGSLLTLTHCNRCLCLHSQLNSNKSVAVTPVSFIKVGEVARQPKEFMETLSTNRAVLLENCPKRTLFLRTRGIQANRSHPSTMWECPTQ